MLRGLRKASSGWLGRTVMVVVVGFLVISFAIWGIGDIFRGFGRSTLAKIGRTEVSIETFRQLYLDRLQLLGRQIGRPITPEQARQLGFDRQIVRQIIVEFIIDERVRSLRLNVGEAEVARRITADPSFQGPNGKFDRAKFEALIRQAGFTEARYVAEQRRGMLRRQLGATVLAGETLPKAMVEAASRYQNEERGIDYVLFDRAQAGDIPAPTPEELTAYYEEHKAEFRAPELRKALIVALLPSERAQWIEISDEDLQRAYQERRNRYLTPERRNIHQIVFSTADEAKAAAERIAKGETFEAIAKERGLSDKDIDLGTVTRASLLDKTVADAAFALKEGEVSAPVQGRFGTVLLRVLKIEPESVKSLDEVGPELRKELALDRAKTEVTTLYDKFEDERQLGTPIGKIAEELKIATRGFETDNRGRDPAGTPVGNLPDSQRLLNAIFTSEPGLDNDPLRFENGYIWYEVSGVTQARDRPLDEVKAEAEAGWREAQTAKLLRTKAADALEKVKSGTPLAEATGLKVETKTGIKRGAAAEPLSAFAVDAVFRTGKDAAGSASAQSGVEQVVFRVTEITVPDINFESDDIKRIKQALQSAVSEDVYGEYIAQVESEIGVSINQPALQRVISGQAPDDN
jgi:peptidyl-prolyl cis-trans isomerase D